MSDNDNGQPQQPSLLDEIWGKAVTAMHDPRKRGQITPALLDQYVSEKTGGRVTSFKQLAQLRMRATSIAGGQEEQKAATPSPIATGAESFANSLALGLPRKLNLGTTVGGGPPERAGDFLNAGEDANPWSAAVGDVAGTVAPSAMAGGMALKAAEPAIARLPIPALARLMVRGGVSGGVGSATAAYASSPDLKPHPGELARAGGGGAVVGSLLFPGAWWAATKLNPAEHMASRMLSESAPGETPSTGAGISALKSGETTPVTLSRPGVSPQVVFQPQPEAAYQALPEELRPMNWEKSPAARVGASKTVLPSSAEAATQFRNIVEGRIANLQRVVRAIEQDPDGGYTSILKRPLTEADYQSLPPGAVTRLRAMKAPTLRDLFDYAKDAESHAQSVQNAKAAGTLRSPSDLRVAAQESQEATAVRQWLGDDNNAPGFQDLQGKVAPYLQRIQQLRLGLRQVIGRMTKLPGRGITVPKGDLLKEGVRELEGYEPRLIAERAARRLVKPLTSSDLGDLVQMARDPEIKEAVPDLLRWMPTGAASVYGGAIGAGGLDRPEQADALPNFRSLNLLSGNR